ncbi:DNA polymerase delta catalytic subunit [Hondaea fermentalgiana]|uniref:DNA polymerase n=1 Tax=Hondaea fermentalgiana TaxID=2315210 RepID=A0A2R5G2Q3_9STRA|nr:DNA polymerase delta catalytic subunit [Hondaea fermentalgiana]|eukprot:GBG24815.1 DNA polymerase delta catalytic subunit [Hondaea fermentalgiana]
MKRVSAPAEALTEAPETASSGAEDSPDAKRAKKASAKMEKVETVNVFAQSGVASAQNAATALNAAKKEANSGDDFATLLADAADAGTSNLSLERPALDGSEMENDIVLQWVDMDMYSGDPLREHPVPGEHVPGLRSGEVPIIRVYGVTDKGQSVMCHVYGVTPYFYTDIPGDAFGESELSRFREALDARVCSAARINQGSAVVAVVIREKMSIMGYCGGAKKRYLQIMMSLPNLVPKAKSVLQNGFACPGFPEKQFMTYESNVPFVLRYMVDNDIVGSNWLTIPKGRYRARGPSSRMSRCQLEVEAVYEDIVSHDPALPEWSAIAPLRIMSFDIECMGRRGVFPDPTQDPVIQIASYIKVQGEDHARAKVVLVLDSCLPIVGAQVKSFSDERELLLEWTRLVQRADPDVVTGYNVESFDFDYLMGRAKALKIEAQFGQLGKLRNKVAKINKKTFSSAAYGTRENSEIEMEGRVVMDMIQYMYRNHKLSSYSLNAVSSEFLGQQKEDVHHSIISDLQRGSDEDRRRLAVYCLKDAYLPLQLLEKLMVLINYLEMARVTGVPVPFLFSRGQQIKVLSMLYRKCLQLDIIVPVLPRAGGDGNGEVSYEGATVIEPIRGFYDEPIATLDFASLYPSVMMAHNLCYTTLIPTGEEKGLIENKDYKKTPTGHLFATTERQKGILPTILEELLAARKRAKKDMKAAKDPLRKAVMNGRQLALKVSANSVYGFTGATIGALPCIPISSSVTAYGREMIDATKAAVERKYTIKNGYKADAQVIYGDTDSVMIKFGGLDVAESMELGLKAANELTEELFIKPIALEFEKVYSPFLLLAKKAYAGMYYCSSAEKPDKMDVKGLVTVRRDNCGLARTVVGTCLHKILVDRSVDDAVAYAKETISALLQNKVDISLLIVTKSLSGKSEDYAVKQAHVELAARMRARDAGSAPVVGDRVPYVIIKAAKGAPAYMKSEDPLYVLQHNIPLDFDYYLDQIGKPLKRIFTPILTNPDSLLHGDHTLKRYKALPSSNVGIARFAVKKLQCIGCRAPIDCKGGLCRSCEKNRESIYLDRLAEANDLEDRFARLWTECQRCQGSLHQDVLCTSRDCPIFYMRKKVQKDIEQVQTKIDRFAEIDF